jgi:hypothetical protein
MNCQWSESEHYVLWLEVPVEVAKLIQLFNGQDDLVEDLVKKLEAPLFFQPLSEAHLLGFNFDFKMIYPQ